MAQGVNDRVIEAGLTGLGHVIGNAQQELLGEVEGRGHRGLREPLVMLVQAETLPEVTELIIHRDRRRGEDDRGLVLVESFVQHRADVHRRGVQTPRRSPARTPGLGPRHELCDLSLRLQHGPEALHRLGDSQAHGLGIAIEALSARAGSFVYLGQLGGEGLHCAKELALLGKGGLAK